MDYKLFLIIIFYFFLAIKSLSQSKDSSGYGLLSKLSVGINNGYEGGGLPSVKCTFSPFRKEQRLQFFGGIGYAFLTNNNEVAYSFGSKFLFPSKRNSGKKYIMPFIVAAYGINASVVVKNIDNLDKQFNGLSLGCGLNINTVPKYNIFKFMDTSPFWQRLYASVSLSYPFSSKDVDNYRNYLLSTYNISTKKIFPLNFSISVNYKIR